MPFIHRKVTPIKLSSNKLKLVGKSDSEFIAVNNETLVNVLRQLGSIVSHANDIFLHISILTEEVGTKIRNVKLRLEELDVKTELFDPKLVPVPEGSLDDPPISHKIWDVVPLDKEIFKRRTRPKFLRKLYDEAGRHEHPIHPLPPGSPEGIRTRRCNGASRKPGPNISSDSQRPPSVAVLRDWKLDECLDDKIVTLNSNKKKGSSPEDLNRILSQPFPSELIQIDVTGVGFDRMKANRRSLIIHTKKIRSKKKRRNTICGSMPNKECAIQTSFSSVNSPSSETTTINTHSKKYGVDSGHWSGTSYATGSGNGKPGSSRIGNGPPSSITTAPSPWDPNSLSTSSDYLFDDDEDRSLTPQLENFTDGMVSDSDSVDTEGYFTSFRNECGFPKSKKTTKDSTDELSLKGPPSLSNNSSGPELENEYDVFGKGSTSSCGTVIVLRNFKPPPLPPQRTSSAEQLQGDKIKSDDPGLEERVKRKSLIERVPSLVVVTPSPSCSSASPPPLKDPLDFDESQSQKSSQLDSDDQLDDELHKSSTETECRASSSSSNASNSTLTNSLPHLPQPDVIPLDIQRLAIRTRMASNKLDTRKEYVSFDTVLLGSSEEELLGSQSSSSSNEESKMNNNDLGLPAATSSKIRGARVVLDANGEIIFSSETLKRKKRPKVSFDPGSAVKPIGYDSSTYSRIPRESVYDRLEKESAKDNTKLYETIEEIRRYNLRESDKVAEEKQNLMPNNLNLSNSSHSSTLMETDLDDAIPHMPVLTTLPKIKDRLKRNESYRIATDELPNLNLSRRPSSLSPINQSTNEDILNRNTANSPNRRRDILEENPLFIQQIFDYNNALLKSPNGNKSNNLNANNYSNSISEPFKRSLTPISKIAYGPEDRPSFLRRESPPTMDEITREIYRFRKKFNIQPNASSKKLIPVGTPIGMPSSRTASTRPPLPPPRKGSFSINTSSSPVPKIPFTPVTSSTPIKNVPPSSIRLDNNLNILPSSNNSNNNSKSFRGLLSALKSPTSTTPSPSVPSTSKSVSFSIPTQKILVSPKTTSPPQSKTSLSDFKRLLQQSRNTFNNTRKSTISAMELLKPKKSIDKAGAGATEAVASTTI